jgi:hypothetical protein
MSSSIMRQTPRQPERPSYWLHTNDRSPDIVGVHREGCLAASRRKTRGVWTGPITATQLALLPPKTLRWCRVCCPAELAKLKRVPRDLMRRRKLIEKIIAASPPDSFDTDLERGEIRLHGHPIAIATIRRLAARVATGKESRQPFFP